MAPAHDDVASGGRRRGRRNLSWGTLFCFGSREALAEEGTTTAWERSRRRRKKRTVPVDGDGDLLAGKKAADPEVMRRGTGTGTDEESSKRKGLRLPGCCFLAPGREHSAMDSSSNKQRWHPERTEQQLAPLPRRSESEKNSPSSEAASRIQATGGRSSTSIGRSRSHGAERPRRSAPPAETTRASTNTKPSKTGAGGGVGVFGPAVGLAVVVAVSMAGLLGGRLWAVACVCAWLAALSRLRRREAKVAAVDVDSRGHKEPVERDRRKAMAAA